MDSDSSLPVDFKAALEQFDNDSNFMLEMFGDFKESLPQRMAEIHAALEEGSPEALRKRAHNLKGVSLTFCANPVAKLAIKIEEAGKRGDMADMAGYVSQLDYEIKRLEEFISNALPH